MHNFKGESTKARNWLATWKDSQVMENGDTYVTFRMDQSEPTQKAVKDGIKNGKYAVDPYPNTVSRTDKNGEKNYTVRMTKSQMDAIQAVCPAEKANAYPKNDQKDERNVVTFQADAILKGNGVVIPNTKDVKPSGISNGKWSPAYSLYRHEANVAIAQAAKAKEREAQRQVEEPEATAEAEAQVEAESPEVEA